MAITRHKFTCMANQSAWGDTGQPFTGEVKAIRWWPVIPFSGADFELSVLSQLGDTGQYGQRAYYRPTFSGSLASQFAVFPRGQASVDTGMSTCCAPIVADNGYLRLKVHSDSGPVAGTFEVWTGD